MHTKGFTIVVLLIACISAVSNSGQSLRHQFLSSFSSASIPSTSTAVSTLQTCKDVGSTWNSVTGAIDNYVPTWTGN